MKRIAIFTKQLWAIACLALLLTSCAPARLEQALSQHDNEIHLIKAPPVQYDKDGNYSFIIFGDTRSGDKNSIDPNDKAFYEIRNKTHTWVTRDLTSSQASFALYSGDLIWRGSATQYWYEIQKQFPLAIRSADTPRIFPVLGNHELWNQEGEGDALTNYFGTFPYLAGDETRFHNYGFIIGSTLFVNLCSGGYGEDENKFAEYDRAWNCTAIKSFDKLMDSLRTLVDRLSEHGAIDTIFVTYHKPSYSTYKHPPLSSQNDPIEVLSALKKNKPELKIFVLNGHNHVTELFKNDSNIMALVAGGGGAPQKKKDLPYVNYQKIQPQELFWLAIGHERYRRVNYYHVHMTRDQGFSIEEQALCTPDGGTTLDYYPGVVIDSDGSVSFKGDRTVDCMVDHFVR